MKLAHTAEWIVQCTRYLNQSHVCCIKLSALFIFKHFQRVLSFMSLHPGHAFSFFLSAFFPTLQFRIVRVRLFNFFLFACLLVILICGLRLQ